MIKNEHLLYLVNTIHDSPLAEVLNLTYAREITHLHHPE